MTALCPPPPIKHTIRRLAALLGVAAALIAAAPGSRAAARCAQIGRGEVSAVVICPPGLDRAAWREAGKTACAARGSCHAWIWDDPRRAPKRPITRANPMTDEEFESAVALWVDYVDTLYVCDGTHC